MNWRLAKSLITLRNQVNSLYPGRSTASDGTIGDAAHQNQGSASDHNPWIKDAGGVGVVSAMDITHDPANGLDIDNLSDQLAESRDNRIRYIIANGLILIPFKEPWAPRNGWFWQAYSGDNPHTKHMHISVRAIDYDDPSMWDIKGGSMKTPPQEAELLQHLAFLWPKTVPAVTEGMAKQERLDLLNSLLTDPRHLAIVDQFNRAGALQAQVDELTKKLQQSTPGDLSSVSTVQLVTELARRIDK